MKAIVLAGGRGTRLYPLTALTSKQLTPVYDKPMIYYPLSTLLLLGIRELCIVSTPEHLPEFRRLLGNGESLGVKIEYREQPNPGGLAQAFLVAEDFVAGDPCGLILGDNLFYGKIDNFRAPLDDFQEGAVIYGYPVVNASAYGVVAFDDHGNPIDIVEKPAVPPSNIAVPGIYFYDKTVVDRCKALAPSPRGELEITDLNRTYLRDRALKVAMLGRGVAWLDTGTPDSMYEASEFVRIIEKRQGLKIGCIEEVAWRMKYIDDQGLAEIIAKMPNCEYRAYLERLPARQA